MNAKFTALFVAITLVAPSISDAGQAVGTAKARGDYSNFQSQRSNSRWAGQARSSYRYSAPRYSAPVIVRSAPVIREEAGPVIAQAPVEARRFSQAPAQSGTVASAKPCPESPAVASQPSSGRRYSYAPAPQYSGSPVRRYSGNVGSSSRELWSLPKTNSGKYNAR